MNYWQHCTTCEAKYKGIEGTTECRDCRGWHPCAVCEQRLPNEDFYDQAYNGERRYASRCRPCMTGEMRADTANRGAARRNKLPNHDNASQVYAAYEITRKERRVVNEALKAYRLHNPSTVCREPRPKSPTPIAVLEAAGYGFDLRISQAVIELYRLETAKREAA